MDKRILELEKVIRAEHGNIAGVAVLHEGRCLYEGYFNGCTAATPVHVFSVTKSVVSMLVGIAIGRGAIKSVEQPVLDFFPGYVPKRGERTIQQVRIKDLLTMTAPYKYRSAPYTKYFTSGDWVKSALDLLGGRGQIGAFRYTPLIGPDILTGILARAVGQPVRAFAQEALFGPLGMAVQKDVTFRDKAEQFAFLRASGVSGWVADPKGVNTAGWGLTLAAMDMAKLGQLYLQGGVWQGEQIVPAGWVEESTREHSRWVEQGLPFGYLWWPGIGSGYAAMGDSGNMIYVAPGKGLVVAINALYKPTAKDRTGLVRDYIEPLVE